MWPAINWPSDIKQQLNEWLNTIGYNIEQLERQVVHILHLKRSIIKLRKTHKAELKKVFEEDLDFIVEYSHQIIADAEQEHIQKWFKDISEKLHLSITTVRLVAQDIATSVINESESTILDHEVQIQEIQNEPQLYCICLQEYDENRHFIACPLCSKSYHIECVGLSYDNYCVQSDLEEMTWVCGQPSCQ